MTRVGWCLVIPAPGWDILPYTKGRVSRWYAGEGLGADACLGSGGAAWLVGWCPAPRALGQAVPRNSDAP